VTIKSFWKGGAVAATALLFILLGAAAAHAQTLGPQQRLCDPEYQDCRADVLQYIAQETVEIDMGYWMITDSRYSNALVSAWQRGVKIRLLMDPRCVQQHPACSTPNDQLQSAGIPMRNRTTSGILHWKMILFASQGQVEFAGANYAPFEMSPDIAYQNYTDEIVMFSNDPSIVHSFMTRFDDLWTSTTEFADYANITAPLTRSYPTYAIDPQLNFPPDDSYRTRAINAYNAENTAIDVAMFRITDERESDAIISAMQRGVPVRLYTDQTEYRNTARLWDAYNVDKMWYAGAQVRIDAHQGINHEKLVVLRGQGMAIFGSSNWTSPSTDSQREHNMFTTQPWILTWTQDQFNRKWTNGSGFPESQPFTPLPPDVPVYNTPANAAAGVATTGVSLSWNGGLWAHIYDIYFGTSPNPPLLAQNQKLGPSQYSTDYRYYALPTLLPGTTYYWKIVSKTMAYKTAEGPVWSFTTAGTAPNDVPPTVSITSPANGATFAAPANITIAASASDSDGTISKVDFYNGSTLIGTSTTSPYTVTWSNVPAGSYSLTAVATDNGNMSTTSSPVSVTVSSTPPPNPLPSGWTDADVGATGAAGSATYSSGTFTVKGAGADVWGTADAFNYAYLPLNGDGWMIARVATVSNQANWVKAGVMIRGSLSASSAQGFMLVSYAKGVAFQRRTADGNTSVSTAGSLSTAPRWVKIVRSGSTITGYESGDGATWTQVGSDTFTMGTSALIGLAVSSHVSGVLATATFDNVTSSTAPAANNPPSVSITSPTNGATYTAPANITITASASDSDGTVSKVAFYSGSTLLGTATTSPYTITWTNVPAGSYTLTAVATDNAGATTTSAGVNVTVSAPATTLPSGWTDSDIGAVPFAGSASYSSGTFTVTGSGADIWGSADAFHYAYRSMTGDGTIIARVTSVQNVASWVKAGVMIRETLSASSTHAFMLVSAAKGVAFQRREVTGGTSVSTAGSLSTAPRWVKLTRSGNTFSAYESADGVTWTLVGTDTIAMQSTVYVGLAVTSHNTSASATCTFDSVTVQ
jgi:phosphatidylserine/phosphatidylglycerophosphate/cardiolipin synthase-like enzyme